MTLVAERYELGELVGEGGMGCVYRATHTVTGKRVALKLMSSEIPVSDATLTRFRREARAAGVLETEHIVQVFDSGIDPSSGQPYIAMELLEGESLSDVVERLGPLPPPVAMRIVAQACAGLGEAHRAGVVHRDIKPSNLFLAKVGARLVVKVLDFGIAKLDPRLREVSDAKDLTHTGTLLGSPHYISPEQIRAQEAVDHRADVWSLGVVLFQALTGQRPHENAKSMMELMFRTYMEKVPSVCNLSPWVEPDDAAIVARAVELAPSDRYPDMAAFRAALLARVSHDGVSFEELKPVAGSAGVVARAAETDATAADTMASDEVMRRRVALASRDATAADTIDSSTDAVASQSLSERPPPMVPMWRSIAIAAGAIGIIAIGWLTFGGDAASESPVAPAVASSTAAPPVPPPAPPAEETTPETSAEPVTTVAPADTQAVAPRTRTSAPATTATAPAPPPPAAGKPPSTKSISKGTEEFD